MKNIAKIIISTILLIALVTSCFAALVPTNAASSPVPGNPGWKAEYSKSALKGTPEGALWDRGNASGDKITSNAHSADWEGVYFYWDDKQKEDGVLLVCDWVFDLFADGYTHAGSGIAFAKGDPGFVLTAKNSNNYWGYKIARSTGKVIDTNDDGKIWAFAIPKQMQYLNTKNGKTETDNLKNINMVFIDGQYKSAWVLLMKAWFDEDGKLVWKPFDVCDLNSKLKFSNGKLGLNEEDFGEFKITDFKTAKDGKPISITETAMPDGYKFKDACIIYGNGDKKGEGVLLTLKPGEKAAVLFQNQKQWAEIELIKVWKDYAEACISAPEGGATFDINGITSYTGVTPGTYKVKEGTYVIKENEIEGFDLVNVKGADSFNLKEQSATIAVNAGKNYQVIFTNKDPITPLDIQLVKTVDGKILAEWLSENFSEEKQAEIRDGMIFNLYSTLPNSRMPDESLVLASSKLADDNTITFLVADLRGSLQSRGVSDLEGWYVIVEHFMPGSTAEAIFADVEPLLIYFDGKSATGNALDFDYGALYTIVNGYGYYDKEQTLSGRILNYPGLNNNGDLFYIGVTNANTGDEYASFCANAGSERFAGDNDLDCRGYLIADKFAGYNTVSYEDFLAALNYIEDKYGNLDENRAITQTVIWALLDAVDVDAAAWDNVDLTPDEKRAVEDVMANYKGYAGKGTIVDLVYMTCEAGHGYEKCQPQLVPIYGKLVIDNKVQKTFDVSFMKTKYDGLLDVDDGEFGFVLSKIVDGVEDEVGICYTNAGGEVVAKDLSPGSYVFREVWTTVFAGGLGFDEYGDLVENYNLVWKVIYPDDKNGLYFTLSVSGDVVWDNEEGVGIVDNKIYGKHTVLWAPDGYDPVVLTLPHVQVIPLGEGNGNIIFINYDGLTMEIKALVSPTCQERGIVHLGCNDGTGASIVFGELCEHDYVYLAIVSDGEHDGYVWFGGQNGCICGGMEYNPEQWYLLDGYDFPEA